MIVGVVLSVPATPLAQRARRRDFRLGEPPRQRRQGPEDAEVIKPGAVLGSVFSAGPPARRSRGHRGQHDRLARAPVTVTVTFRPLTHAISQSRPAARSPGWRSRTTAGPVGPARLPRPRPHQEIPSWPRLALTLYATSATGSVTCGIATIWRRPGSPARPG